jgi:uncharacterized protein (DUF1800 family)
MRLRAVIAAASVVVTAAAVQPHRSVVASQFPNDDKTIIHVLNRIGFGPRSGDVEKVKAIGLQKYIEEQLRPDRVSDSAIDARLAGFQTLKMSNREIAEDYEMPLEKARQAKKEEQADNKPPAPDPMAQKANSVLVELAEAKIIRAVYSERQLEEVLTDFWFNHFNVDARKGPDRFMLTEYERDVIRPRVLGKFRDLLEADAKSPAMLFYLDNWMSVDPNGPHPPPGRFVPNRFGGGRFVMPPNAQQNQNNPRKGLNENYGRELMELHTLGVDGGYTQKDVTEVARAFTGWTIQQPRQGGSFHFEPRLHDDGQKIVMGHVIKAGGGQSDGERVLDILASHPSTAHFIATKLVRRFVSDTPPPALVDRVAERFLKTNGDLREVMHMILTSPEFLGPEAYRAKVKTPFEFVVSALRATSAEIADARPIVQQLQQLGEPLYQCQPPTGYKDTADAWVNTGALVSRMNFSVALAANRVPRTSVADPSIVSSVLGDDVSDATKTTIAKATGVPQMAALTLGSPEFQRR